MTATVAIKRYFEREPNARKVTMDELKALSKEDRRELGRLACEELGEHFDLPAAA